LFFLLWWDFWFGLFFVSSSQQFSKDLFLLLSFNCTQCASKSLNCTVAVLNMREASSRLSTIFRL
jgi:hypothetical protein